MLSWAFGALVIARGSATLAVLLLGACSSDDAAPQADTVVVDDGSDESSDPGTFDERASVTHAFGETSLAAFEEVEPCVSWTLHNEQALWVQGVTLANLSGFHHSNWFVVPDSVYDGADGYWDCEDRGYEELEAAMAGTVLFAQSTQSWVETQRLGEGVVIKIPPHSRIVGGVHLLNLAARPIASDLWLTLDLVHPGAVDVVVTPMRLSFLSLYLEALSETRHDADCQIGPYYSERSGRPWDLKIHHVLPHYHSLGNWFDLRMVGGPRHGESLYRLEGFGADANGRTYDPPLDVSDGSGLGFTCGYDNFRSEDVSWGIGDQEMCVMLLLVESELLLETTVPLATFVGEDEKGVKHRVGECLTLGVPKSGQQRPPTEAELAAPLYVPPVDPDDAELPPVPECRDADPTVAPAVEPTLAALRASLFAPACSFADCHGSSGAAGLDLTVDDLHSELLEHEPLTSAGIPIVVPGDPDGSWLYRVLAECSPPDGNGSGSRHMPLNAPVLLDDAIVASVRAWIEAGALAP